MSFRLRRVSSSFLMQNVASPQAFMSSSIATEIVQESLTSKASEQMQIPTDLHPVTKKSALETLLMILHAGGKFGGSSSGYSVSGGLHGVGLSVVNALSEALEVTVWRDGKEYQQKYSRGKPVTALICPELPDESKDRQGTHIKFWPDKEVFTTAIQFDYPTIAGGIRELAFLNPELAIVLKKEDTDPEKCQFNEYCYAGGLVEYVRWLNTDKEKSKNAMKVRGCVKYNHTSGSRSFASQASMLATMVSKITEQSKPSVTYPLSKEQIFKEVLGRGLST